MDLFILARNVAEFKLKHESKVLQLVKDLGFTSLYNSPIETYQGSDCLYNSLLLNDSLPVVEDLVLR